MAHGLFFGGISPLAAAEQMPLYADSKALREDATLRAVAFAQVSGDAVGTGIACGDRGTILRSQDAGQTWQAVESGVDCCLREVVWVGPRQVVAAGGDTDRITGISRGVVLISTDAGSSWQRGSDAELARFRAIRQHEDGWLLARCDWSHSLLTSTLASHDEGRSWQAVDGESVAATVSRPPTTAELSSWTAATGMPVAVRDACRLAGASLCGVGDHGVILLSMDNGKSWTVVRGQQRQTAILMVADRPSSVAWSLLGGETLEHRNRVALLLYQTESAERGVDPSPLERTEQVAVMLGGSGADAIAGAATDLGRSVSEWMWIHRPAVVVIDRSLPTHVQDACLQAATSGGVARVVSYGHDAGGNLTLHRDALLPRYGILASDLHADAMQYLAPRQTRAESISLRYLLDLQQVNARGDSVVSGILLSEGQKLAAPAQAASRRQLQIVQARQKQSERITQLLRTARSPGQFAKSLAESLDQTAKHDQFRMAWQMILETEAAALDFRYRDAALEQLANRFPETTAGRWAALRRHSLQHSLEWAPLRSTLGEAATLTAGVAQAVPVSPFQVPPTGTIEQVAAISPIVVPKAETQESKPRVKRQVDVDLSWEFHPLVLIARDAARRRGDDGQLQVADAASADLQRLAQANHSPWSGLLSTGGPQVVIARRAASPPRLDGILDDPCWQSALPPAGRKIRVRVAYDEQYVYVAAACPDEPFLTDSISDPATFALRDHDLTGIDRLHLAIDVDRDLLTSMQLQVTSSGRTHDAIDGHPAWQPTWYVDTRRQAGQLTIELAILRRDLVELPITAGESWYLSAFLARGTDQLDEPLLPDPRQWMRVRFQP
jgi:hypothetical protein